MSLQSSKATSCRIAFAAVSIIAALMVGNAHAAAAPVLDAEWPRTVEAAKKEGKVSVFLYQRENIEAAVKAFEKIYPE
ncbi:MAG: hypothetical protein ACXW6K_18190, partial [Candidatus Binatia bacterium]